MRILSVDGGGSKTDILLWRDGDIYFERLDRGINHHIHGAAEAGKRLINILESYEADIYVVGLAGLDTEGDWALWREVLGRLHGREAILLHDVEMALYAGEGRGEGVVVISGTGSNIYARRGGTEIKMGDWGSPYGDDYSAHEVGSRVLRRFLRMYDGRAVRTGLYKYLSEKLGTDPVEAIYGLGIPGVARLGVETCIEKPHEIIDVLEEIAYGAARAAYLAAERAGLLGTRIHYTGGLFRCPVYAKLFRKHIRYRGLILGRYIRLPVVGGVAIGLERLGEAVDNSLPEELERRLGNYAEY